MIAQSSAGMEAVPAFLITLALLPITGVAVIWTVQKMISGDLDAAPGIAVFLGLLGMMAASIASRNPVVPGAFIVILISLMAFYPYAESQMGKLVGREANAIRIDRAHEELSRRPDNVAAWFELARCLHDHGFQGQAIAISETTLNKLGQNVDPLKFTSMRDHFRGEDLLLRRWQAEAKPELCRPLKCPLCHRENPVGVVSCEGCGKPYLLEIVRGRNPRKSFLSRLIFGWVLIMGLLCVSAWASISASGSARMMIPLFGFGLVGVVLFFLFRPPKGDQTMGGPGWGI